MKVIIIAGFLGSGKTTLLLQMARSLSSASRGTVIIENELGEVGVDGDYLNCEGLQVRQLFGGCVCCTLSSGLMETLEQLDRQYHPDTVLLEATGAADPGEIAANVSGCRLDIRDIRVITLVDANRYAMLIEMMTPLLTSQIRAADMVVVNKIDLVSPEHAERIVQDIRNLNARGRVCAVSLERETDLSIFMNRIEC